MSAIAYVGIDNGISGGLVALSSAFAGPIIDKIPMPVQKTRKGNEVDVITVKDWLERNHLRWQDIRIVIEEPGGSKSAKAAASMAASFHALRGAFAWAGIAIHRVTPQAWQKAVLGTCDDTKAAALTKARELWPAEDWRASDRCRVAHDGMVDAALLALYGRRLLL